MNAGRESTNLDLLRSIAVSFVVASHLIPYDRAAVFDWRALGLLGVLLFFVHTSLVLMLSLERQEARSGRAGAYLGFEIRRVFRIYPLSIVVVLLHFFLAQHGLAPACASGALDLISNLLLIQNVTQVPPIPTSLWSLAFEVQMYLVLPVLFTLVAHRVPARDVARLPLPAWTMLALWGGTVAVILGLWAAHVDYSLVKYVPCFLPGVLAYTLRARRASLPPWALFAWVLVLAVAVPLLVARGTKEASLGWPVCLSVGALIPFVRDFAHGRLASVGKLIAKYSYGIYLTHLWAIWFGFDALAGQLFAVRCLAFAGALGVLTVAAFHFIEQPLMKLGASVSERYVASRNRRSELKVDEGRASL